MGVGEKIMKVAVVGMWHLGTVTAACLANASFNVIAYDPDVNNIANLQNAKASIFEPGLAEMLASVIANKKFYPTAFMEDLANADIVWVNFDTPVDEADIADTDYVVRQIKAILPYLQLRTTVLISSQLPVGTTANLQEYSDKNYPEKRISFAYSPENLRLGKAIEVFQNPERVIVGIRNSDDKLKILEIFKPFTENLFWMEVESAEMVKHALNAFLATSVVFINEIASLCEQTGAKVKEVERGLKSDNRIGYKSYLRAGEAIAGGTLARDVNFLNEISLQTGTLAPLLSSILESNQRHKQWQLRKVQTVLKSLAQKKVAILGLAYKANTDTLRRSATIETCFSLSAAGSEVFAYDPIISSLPDDVTQHVLLKLSIDEVLENADALIITNNYPEFAAINVKRCIDLMKTPHIIDASGFFAEKFADNDNIYYYTVGS